MADKIAQDLQDLIASKNTWTAPCTFTRSNPMPFDPKSCFYSYSDLTTYLGADDSTAYPGMIVAVTSSEDAGQGLYIITSTGSTLVPVKLGTKQEIDDATKSATINWLTGDESEEEEEPTPGD